MEIINGYPCKFCSGQDIEVKNSSNTIGLIPILFLGKRPLSISAETVKWFLYALLNIRRNVIIKGEN